MSTIYRHRIEAGPIIFNDAPFKPAAAQAWGVDVLDGWKTSPAVEVNSTSLGALRDGEDYGDYFPMRSRFVTIGGYVAAATAADAEALHDILVRDAFPRNVDLVLARFESVPKFVRYRRTAAVETDWVVETGFRWNTTLGCQDPLLYSVDTIEVEAGTAGQSTSGVSFPVTFPFTFTATVGGADDSTAGVINSGTAPSPYVIATITGPLPRGGWRLRNDTTDEEIFFDVGLATGETMLIDFTTQQLVVNGFPYSARRSGDFWRLAPGNNAIRLYTEFNADTTLTIQAKSAWE